MESQQVQEHQKLNEDEGKGWKDMKKGWHTLDKPQEQLANLHWLHKATRSREQESQPVVSFPKRS